MSRLKNRGYIVIAFVVMLMASGGSTYAQSSVLSSGTWVKFAVTGRGVYKIDFNLLNKAGINPSGINPKKIRIYGQGGGMLPQPNATPRPVDLIENAIFVSGESDGTFNNNDFILFFAEGPDEVKFLPGKDVFYYEHNLYSDTNFYYLTISDDDGKRITQSENIAGNFPAITSFNDFVFHESDEHNELTSGREWFGELFDINNERKFTFDVSGIIPGSTMKWISDVMSQTPHSQGSSFKLFLNNSAVKEQVVLPSSAFRYGVKGQHQRDTIIVSADATGAASQTSQEIKYQFVKGQGTSVGYLDFFLVCFSRELSLTGTQTIFRSSQSIQNPISTFEVSQVSSDVTIWNISDPNAPSSQVFTQASGVAKFSTVTSSLNEFVVFNTSVPSPEFIGKISNQNLHGISTPQLLIITHPDFRDDADRLANHRSSYSNLTVAVVTPQQIYNEFSSGRQDVSAIRDFIRHLYTKNPSTLKSVLIMGRGSYDYKDRINNNTNFVPAYESRNSLYPLETYSSDDFYGFMEASEGEWQEYPAVDHTLDVAVGRLTVKTKPESQSVVDKLIDYDLDKKNYGKWRKEITFVADDGNNDDNFSIAHQKQANTLAEFIEAEHPEFDTKKLFLGTYTKEIRPSGETASSLNDAINKAFDKGTLIINYTGHGSERVWADERILTDFTIPELSNDHYPFMITATCEFGRQDDPQQISSAELCLVKANSGAIGLVSTARPVSSDTNFELNGAFYDALFEKDDEGYLPIGEVFRRTKNNSISGVSNRNFSLLGDPSMKLAMPQQQIVVTSILTENSSPTLKALSKVILSGEIQDDSGNKLSDYSGTLEATLFDKRTPFKTIGKNLFTFDQWYNALFRGKATVKDGEFEMEFMMPKNIAYEPGQGKLSLYFSDPESHLDAAGSDLSFDIGESEINIIPDNTAPVIKLFMGDTTFINGGITNPDTYLVARLKDASGINISSYGIGNDIIAILDDGESFVLNDYYTADKDDFTSGMITYPINGLSPGRHTLTVKAWDNHNNPAEAALEFIVTDGKTIVIEDFGNFPNPARGETTFYFTHNRSGDDLEAELSIFSSTGMMIKRLGFTVKESSYRVEFPAIDLRNDVDKNLPPGLYLARLVIRSVTNASKNERVTKLILLN